MRNMNCRNARSEIEETRSGYMLSPAVNAHINSCAACDTLFRQHNKLQAIISSLGTVEAPDDFDFRVRARLAGEKRGTARPSALGDFSFGFRSAAVAMTLLLIVAAFVVVSLRPRLDGPTTPGEQQIVKAPVTPSSAANPSKGNEGVKLNSQEVAVGSKESQPDPIQGDHGTQRHRRGAAEVATFKGDNRVKETSSTAAEVLTRYDQLAETYPTAAFPINASYQALKLSVNDGRGSSRTISLPTVSFGSQRALSQSSSPLMASARGVW